MYSEKFIDMLKEKVTGKEVTLESNLKDIFVCENGALYHDHLIDLIVTSKLEKCCEKVLNEFQP